MIGVNSREKKSPPPPLSWIEISYAECLLMLFCWLTMAIVVAVAGVGIKTPKMGGDAIIFYRP